MSDPIDIKALDEYLKGDSDISRRYRELGSESVPPELDRRVLDEARAAVASSSGGRARSWLRWSAPLAVAASVVLVVTVVIESGVENDVSYVTQPVAADKARVEQSQEIRERKLEEQVAQELHQERQFAPEPSAVVSVRVPGAPAPAAAPPPAAFAKVEAQRANNGANNIVPEAVTVDAKSLRSDAQEVAAPVTVVTEPIDSPAPQIVAEQPAPPRVEIDSADNLSSVSVSSTRTRSVGRAAGPRTNTSGPAVGGETRPAADEDVARADLHSEPQKWLEEIRGLRRAGKNEEADRAWEQFHKAFPDFPVPDNDLARKQH